MAKTIESKHAFPCLFESLDKKFNYLKLGLKDKSAYVTGGAGMIGTALTYALLKCGVKVTVIDNLTAENSTWSVLQQKLKGDPNIPKDNRKVNFIGVDMTKQFDFLTIGAPFAPNYIFHLAAVIGGILKVQDDAATIFRDNTMMTIHLYDAIRLMYASRSHFGGQLPTKVVMFSSSTVYEKLQDRPFAEKDISLIPPPTMFYAFQKLFNEKYAICMEEHYKIPYIIIRPFNVYGPGETCEGEFGLAHVIPDLIYKHTRKHLGEHDGPVEIFGDGEQVRAYTWIEDFVTGVLHTSVLRDNDDFNVSSDKTHTVNEVNKIIEKMIWDTPPCYMNVPPPKEDVRVRMPVPTKLKRLGWEPLTDLESGLAKTLDWLWERQGLIENHNPKDLGKYV